MKKKQRANKDKSRNDKSRNQATDLAGHYSEIGVAAVAASVRYQGARSNPRHSPARGHNSKTENPRHYQPETD